MSTATTWTNQRFNPSDAKQISDASHPDLPTTTSQSSSASKPTGAIVGGIIGGLAVILSFIALSLYIIRRHRRPLQDTTHSDERLAHMRKISDATVVSGNMTLADSSSVRPIVQTPSISNMQRSASISSLPFFNSLIGRDSRTAMRQTPAPQDPGVPPIEEVITPYTLPPMNDVPEKKHSDGEWPVFDQPGAPPHNTVRMAVLPSTPQRKTGTIRYNPPAYSESDTTTPLSPTMSRHQGQDSIDSTLSTPLASEASDSTARRVVHTPANSGSSSSHMGISNPVRASTSTFHTLQTSISTRRTSVGAVSMPRAYGRSLFTSRSRDTMTQTEESFSPSEIA